MQFASDLGLFSLRLFANPFGKSNPLANEFHSKVLLRIPWRNLAVIRKIFMVGRGKCCEALSSGKCNSMPGAKRGEVAEGCKQGEGSLWQLLQHGLCPLTSWELPWGSLNPALGGEPMSGGMDLLCLPWVPLWVAKHQVPMVAPRAPSPQFGALTMLWASVAGPTGSQAPSGAPPGC